MELWKVAFGVAGIGGVVSFVLYSLYKQWLTLPGIFQQMTREQQYQLFRLFLILTFLFALSGLGAYVYVATVGSPQVLAQEPEKKDRPKTNPKNPKVEINYPDKEKPGKQPPSDEP